MARSASSSSLNRNLAVAGARQGILVILRSRLKVPLSVSRVWTVASRQSLHLAGPTGFASLSRQSTVSLRFILSRCRLPRLCRLPRFSISASLCLSPFRALGDGVFPTLRLPSLASQTLCLYPPLCWLSRSIA